MLEDQLMNTLWYRQRTHLSSYPVILHSTIVKVQFGENFDKLTMDWEDSTLPTMHAISINNCDSR